MKFVLVKCFWLNIAWSTFFLFGVHAGLEEFTRLDEIGGWIIERKVSGSGNKIFCRASFLNSGTWFSTRIRLDKKDNLVVPPQFQRGTDQRSFDLEVIKKSLQRCRSSLIYYR